MNKSANSLSLTSRLAIWMLIIAIFFGPLVAVFFVSPLISPLVLKTGLALIKTVACVTLVTVGLSVWRYQRRGSLAVIVVLISSIFWLVSSAIDYAYIATIAPLPAILRGEVHRVIDIESLSQGLTYVAQGCMFAGVALTHPQKNSTLSNEWVAAWPRLRLMALVAAIVYFIFATIHVLDSFWII